MAERGELAARIRAGIRDVADFPKPGISFKDITPLLADAVLYRDVILAMASDLRDRQAHTVVGIESRGFLFAAPLAVELGCGFVPVRKPGKLPYATQRVEYALEYGTDSLEAHVDGVEAGSRVLIVDDVLATGGTAAATARLVQGLGGEVVGLGFVLELSFLHGRDRLQGLPVDVLVAYD